MIGTCSDERSSHGEPCSKYLIMKNYAPANIFIVQQNMLMDLFHDLMQCRKRGLVCIGIEIEAGSHHEFKKWQSKPNDKY